MLQRMGFGVFLHFFLEYSSLLAQTCCCSNASKKYMASKKWMWHASGLLAAPQKLDELLQFSVWVDLTNPFKWKQ